MKNLIRVSLIKSITVCHAELGKFLCKLLAVKAAESSRPSVVNSEECFTTNQQLVNYLHRSDSATKKYRYLDLILFINEGGHIMIKKNDVDSAVKLYSHLAASSDNSSLRSASAPHIFTCIVEP
jgi:hypothetical protein